MSKRMTVKQLNERLEQLEAEERETQAKIKEMERFIPDYLRITHRDVKIEDARKVRSPHP